MAEPFPDNDTRQRQLLGFLKGSAIGATIVVAALVAIGLYERNRASFAIRYGEQVTVTVADWCVDMSWSSCLDATWTIDGRTYTGTLHLGSTERASSPKEAWTVPGDDRAYTAGHDSASPDGLEAIGLVPRWLGVPVLLIMIGAALPARVWRRVGGSAGTATRTSIDDGR
ncbi:MAG TPA: hypothetical protein VFY84_11600 [Jiangellales bacterium]|nr:hypothetical protein [Jiangellales bacterium]